MGERENGNGNIVIVSIENSFVRSIDRESEGDTATVAIFGELVLNGSSKNDAGN